MLDLEIIPEKAITTDNWEIVIGSPVGDVIQTLQSQCARIKSVDFAYSENYDETSDYSITLPLDGIRFLFCPNSQRLRKIEIFDLAKCSLKYGGLHFNSPQVTPNLSQIDSSFGATHPGEYCSKSNEFILTFRGLAFTFDTTGEPAAGSVVQKCFIFDGNNYFNCEAPQIAIRDVIQADYCEFTCDNDKPQLSFSLFTDIGVEGKTDFTRVVKFGDFSQDVLAELGNPDRIHYKSEDKMKIHLGQNGGYVTDYFYNYFNLGVDLLFDGKTHQVKKFILHTNYPGHYDFSVYNRCEFRISVPYSSLKQDLEYDELIINPRTDWSLIADRLIEPISRPVNLRRTSSANNTNPWGSTECYSFGNMIFEVMNKNQIATIIIF